MANMVADLCAASTITGNQVTVTAQTLGSTGTGTLTTGAASAKKVDLVVSGDVHVMLRFPFADPESFEGMLLPTDLRTAQIKLTQGGAGAALALIAEEVYAY